MNIRVVVIVLVALVAASALVLFYGALRPAPEGTSAKDSVAAGLGWLASSRTLTFDDVQNVGCAESESSSLIAFNGAPCEVPLPNPSGIYLCSDEPASVTIRTTGENYPDQRVKAKDLACDAPTRIPIYDEGTVLTVSCELVAFCAVNVVTPPDE